MLNTKDRCGEMVWVKEGDLSYPENVMLSVDDTVAEDMGINAKQIGSYLRNIQQSDQEALQPGRTNECDKLTFVGE